MATGNQAGRDVNVTAIGQQHIHPPKPPTDDEIRKQLHLWQVPMLSQNFTGRTELLSALYSQITSSANPVAITVCHGLGGIGKTQLVLKYVDEHHQEYQNVFWFVAETKDQLLLNYRDLAEKLSLPIDEKSSPEKIAGQVKHWLENHTDWLVVYDNVQDPQLLKSYQPNRGGRVIITSRRTDWIGISQLEVNVFSKNEAEDYIIKITGFALEQNQSDIDALAKQLGYLPLALAQACAYIVKERIDIAEYLSLYQKKRSELHTNPLLPYKDEHEAVAVTWNITIDAISKSLPCAKELLYCCAYLAGDSIDQELLQALLSNLEPNSTEEMLRKALNLLQDYSMLKKVSKEQKTSRYMIHRLVQDVMFDGLSAERRQSFLLEIVGVLQGLYPYKTDPQLEDYVRQRNLLPHLEKSLSRVDEWLIELKKEPSEIKPITFEMIEEAILLELLIKIADGYSKLGDALKNKELLERSLIIKEKHYGFSHVEVGEVLVNLGISYGDLGDILKKKELLERALEILEKHYGRDHVGVAKTLGNLGTAYGSLGEAGKQKELLERALEILEKHYGPAHVEVAVTLMNLGNAYGDLGDARKKKELLERALKIQEKHYGPSHVEVARTLTNLGNAYGSLGDARKQKELLERALEIKEKHYGPVHVEVAITLTNLGNAYGSLGDAVKKKELLERALEILEKHYGPSHVEVAKTLMNLEMRMDL